MPGPITPSRRLPDLGDPLARITDFLAVEELAALASAARGLRAAVTPNATLCQAAGNWTRAHRSPPSAARPRAALAAIDAMLAADAPRLGFSPDEVALRRSHLALRRLARVMAVPQMETAAWAPEACAIISSTIGPDRRLETHEVQQLQAEFERLPEGSLGQAYANLRELDAQPWRQQGVNGEACHRIYTALRRVEGALQYRRISRAADAFLQAVLARDVRTAAAVLVAHGIGPGIKCYEGDEISDSFDSGLRLEIEDQSWQQRAALREALAVIETADNLPPAVQPHLETLRAELDAKAPAPPDRQLR